MDMVIMVQLWTSPFGYEFKWAYPYLSTKKDGFKTDLIIHKL